jgi:acyl-coenzyme A synthetase/AMP-(fatty) acid ligase
MAECLRLSQLLQQQGRADDYPVAFRHGTTSTVDFAAFGRSVAAWRTAFAAQSGVRWALYSEDALEFAAALFGAWYAGKCAVLPPDILPATLKQLRTQVDGFAGAFPSQCKPLMPAAEIAQEAWHLLDETAEGVVIFTSGTSGQPEAIPKRLDQLFNEIETQAGLWRARWDGARILATVSHQHIYGLLFRVLLPLALGRPFDAYRLNFPEEIALFAAEAPAVLIASPAHLKRLPQHLDWAAARNHLRAVYSSGGPLSTEALQLCRNVLGQAPVEIYGSSETGGIAWRHRMDDAASFWHLFPGVTMQTEDETAVVHTPFLRTRAGYVLNDRVRQTASGFELLGRADRIVKIEEKRVSLTHIEQILLGSGLLAEVRVFVLPGERGALAAVAVPSAAGWAVLDAQGKLALNAALRAQLSDAVETVALPRRWRYVWALPVNAQGKTTEADLLAQFDARRPEGRLLSHDETQAVLQLEVADSLPYFDGHFPDAPILPGVAQIEWAIRFGRELFALPPHFLRMEAVKFQHIIQPGARIRLELGYNAERGSLSFKLLSASATHASGRIVFGGAA